MASVDMLQIDLPILDGGLAGVNEDIIIYRQPLKLGVYDQG